MRIIARSSLLRFSEELTGRSDQSAVKAALNAWFMEVRAAQWRSSADLKRAFTHASIVSADRVVFNIKGNSYRLVVSIDYSRQTVFIKWLGNHRDYDKIDAKTFTYDD